MLHELPSLLVASILLFLHIFFKYYFKSNIVLNIKLIILNRIHVTKRLCFLRFDFI